MAGRATSGKFQCSVLLFPDTPRVTCALDPILRFWHQKTAPRPRCYNSHFSRHTLNQQAPTEHLLSTKMTRYQTQRNQKWGTCPGTVWEEITTWPQSPATPNVLVRLNESFLPCWSPRRCSSFARRCKAKATFVLQDVCAPFTPGSPAFIRF